MLHHAEYRTCHLVLLRNIQISFVEKSTHFVLRCVMIDPNQEIICSIIEKFVKENQKEEGPVGVLTEALGIKAR